MANYSVLEFEDGLHLVPTLWLNADKTSCRWPTHFKKQYDVNKAVIHSTIPNKDWGSFDVKRIFGTADSYEKGMNKLCLAEETSNMEETAASNDEAKAIRAKKRRREKAKKHFTSSSDEEIPEKQPATRLQPFPTVSQFYARQSEISTAGRKSFTTRGEPTSSKENPVFNALERSLTGLDESLTWRAREISSAERKRFTTRGDPTSSEENAALNELERSFTSENDYLTESASRGMTRRNFLSPLPSSRTLKTKIQEDTFTKPTIPKQLYKTRDEKNEASTTDSFKRIVLSKLNKVLYWVKEVNGSLTVLAERGHTLHHLDEFDSEDEEELGLPLREVSQLTTFDKKLKNATFFAKMIKWLSRFGGTEINASTYKMLGKLVSNSLAQQYSWSGLKGKHIFKNLRLIRLVMKTVRVRVPEASDVMSSETKKHKRTSKNFKNKEICSSRRRKPHKESCKC